MWMNNASGYHTLRFQNAAEGWWVSVVAKLSSPRVSNTATSVTRGGCPHFYVSGIIHNELFCVWFFCLWSYLLSSSPKFHSFMMYRLLLLCHMSFYVCAMLYPVPWWCALALLPLAMLEVEKFPPSGWREGCFAYHKGISYWSSSLWEEMSYSTCHLGQTLEFAISPLNPMRPGNLEFRFTGFDQHLLGKHWL